MSIGLPAVKGGVAELVAFNLADRGGGLAAVWLHRPGWLFEHHSPVAIISEPTYCPVRPGWCKQSSTNAMDALLSASMLLASTIMLLCVGKI